MRRRSLLVTAGWLGAVVLAVLVGLGAISVIGAGLTSSDTAPKTEAQVARELAALPGSALPGRDGSPGSGAAGSGSPGSGLSGSGLTGSEPPASGVPGSAAPGAGLPGAQSQDEAQSPPGSGVLPPPVSRPRTAPPKPSATAGRPPATASRSFNTSGGTVVATCSGAGATITSMSPGPDFEVHERNSGPRTEAEGEFRSTVDNHDRVRFSITCSGGRPVLSLRD